MKCFFSNPLKRAHLKMKKFLFAFTLTMLFAQGAFATDWYVDGKNGSDTNPGTKAAPFFNGWKGVQSA